MQQRAEAGRLDMRVSSMRERRVEVRREWESEQAETRSSLCTDLLSREHFNYSTLLTKFQLWLSQASSKKETARECERARERESWAIWFAAWAVKSLGHKNWSTTRTICGCWQCKKPEGLGLPKMTEREREGAANLSEGSTHCVCQWRGRGGGGHEQGQLVCLLCQAYALLLLALA